MTEAYRPVDELPEEPPVPPPGPLSEPRTRTTRRPAAGGAQRPSQRPRGRPKGSKTKAAPAPVASPADAIRGLMQLPAAGFIIAGQRVQSVALVADGATILVHGPGVANAIAEIAEHDPRVMALLDKVLAFGPYGVLLAALFPMVAQFGRNHNEQAAPILEGFGAVSPEQIIKAASLDVPVPVSPNGQAVTPDGATATE
jgi:hypothetical protein